MEKEVKEKRAVPLKKNEPKNFTEVYQALKAIDVSDKVERQEIGRNGEIKQLSYLSWVYAMDIITEYDPNWSYRIIEFNSEGIEVEPPAHGYPYQKVLGGFLVWTEVQIKGFTRRMWLPIMDRHYMPMRDRPYATKSFTVVSVNSMVINKTIMRCLVKNIAMFGLGINLYAGEDIPSVKTDEDEVAGGMTLTKAPAAEKTPAPETQPQETPAADEGTATDKEMSLNEAMEYVSEFGNMAGKRTSDLILKSKDPEKSKKILKILVAAGGKEKQAAERLEKALDAGEIKFPEPPEQKPVPAAPSPALQDIEEMLSIANIM